MLWRFVLVVMSVAGASCHSGADSAGISLDQLVDGAWELRVDRAWANTGDRRSTELGESDYWPVSDGATFPIVVSDHGAKVTIGTAPEWNRRLRFPLKGSRSLLTEAIIYNLDQGTFAGGRFVVWPGDQTLQGELTIYGSGLPIVASVRGRLSRHQR